MKHKILALMISAVCISGNAMAGNAQLGDSAYAKEAYSQAVEHYKKALADGQKSADVYYNLGNSHYRQGNVAQAVLSYERALKLNPGMADASANLEFVNSRLEDKPEDNNSLLTRANNAVVAAVSANSWAWIALGVFVLLCAAAALYIFASNIALRKTGFFGGMALIPLTVYFVTVAAMAAARVGDNSYAVVTAPSTLLNSVPRQPKKTEKVVPLHAGTKVQIVDSIATPDDPVSPRWYNVKIGGGSHTAWLRATDVERI